LKPTTLTAVVLFTASLALACSGESSGPLETPADPSPQRPRPYFVDIAADAGVDIVQITGDEDANHIIDSLGTGAGWLDYDNDGDPDLYLVQGATRAQPEGPPDRLLRNDGDDDGDGIPRFTDVTEAAGLGDRNWSVGISAADYDNDGDTDIHLANWGANRLYRNDGDGTFTDVSAAAGIEGDRWSASADWTDVDRDGDLDLYVANYVEFTFERYPARGETPVGDAPCVWRGIEIYCGPRNLEAAADVFYRNDGDPDGDGIPTFVDATVEAGLAVPEALFALSARAFDADNDGDDDIYVANDSVQNLFFVNQGDGTFIEDSILAGLAYNEVGTEQAGMGIGVGDYDGNGTIDVAVTNFAYDHDTLYRNDGDLMFTDVSFPAGLGTPSYLTLGWGIEFLDLDLDGWQDLYVCHGHVYPQVEGRDASPFRALNGLIRNAGDGTLEPFSHDGGPGLAIREASRALAAVDLEDDGDLDLLVTNVNTAPNLLLNEGSGGHWISVRLVGKRSNRDGIGARVGVTVGGREQVREVRRSAPYAGSVLPRAHFGLGEHTSIERLTVRWPSGARTDLTDVKADQVLTIEEPG